MYVRKLATPTNAELTANPERLRIVAKSNIEKAFLEADNKERLTATLNTTTIRVLAAILGELTGKSYDPEDACKEYWVARVAEYFIHIRKVRLHEKFRTHSISEIQNNPAFAMLQDLVGGKGYTQAYVILCASAAKDLKAMCKAFNLKNISRLNQKKIYAQLLVDFADEYWLLYSDFDERKDNSHHATAEITTTSNHDSAPASQPANFANAQSDSNSQHEALYYDDSFSDTPGDNSCPEQDIPECRQAESIPDDNPGFTIEPSREIARPHYASYPDVISDDCPSITVHACDIQTHTSAIVPYSQAANIRSIFHIIAIYIRLWLAMHITHPDLHFEDFPDGLFTHYTIRKSPRKKLRRAHFEVGSSYTASCYNRKEKKLQSFTFLVTGRVVYSDSKDNRKGVMLYVTCNHPDKHDFEGKGRIQYVDSDHCVEVYHYRKCHDTVYGDIVFSFRADRRDNTPCPFKDTTPSEPDYKPLGYATQFISRDFLNYSDNHDTVQTVHAGTHEINPIQPDANTKSHKPKSAPTSEHDSKLIETKNLHFAEKRAALDANASIITTCLFPVTVMDSLSNLSSKAIIQLGIHMGLFIAKPKGSKRIIIEEFSRRFFAVRNRRTTITTHVRPQPVKEAAQSEGIKIFTNAKQQICFSFED